MALELKEGMTAPEFRLPASTGGELSLGELRGSPVVLYFYPKDDTPGCTREACSFRDLSSELEALGAKVLGVSKDNLQSHQRFVDKYQLNFPLLSDASGAAISAYGAWKSGAEAKSINRSTFLIDAEGKIRRIWRAVKVDGHQDEVLAELRRLVGEV
jgi:thioredoxin-dependent peroxiredoxin